MHSQFATANRASIIDRLGNSATFSARGYNGTAVCYLSFAIDRGNVLRTGRRCVTHLIRRFLCYGPVWAVGT